jgi:hypothetical protein
LLKHANYFLAVPFNLRQFVIDQLAPLSFDFAFKRRQVRQTAIQRIVQITEYADGKDKEVMTLIREATIP